MREVFTQGLLFPEITLKKSQETQPARSGTFTDNMKLPIHRWFRYSAGFSAKWAISEITRYHDGDFLTILDPFAGSATTLLAAESVQVKSIGFENHPFIYRVAKAKLGWNVEVAALRDTYRQVIAIAKTTTIINNASSIAPLLKQCFTVDGLNQLTRLRNAYLSHFNDGSSLSELIWLAITSIIRPCSTAGTAPWQYVLPNKPKATILNPFEAFTLKMEQIIEDINYAKINKWLPFSNLLLTDARAPELEEGQLIDLVISSPPYPNNYDYADATRLEMTFWGEIEGWGELHQAVRQYLIRSCSQHSAKEKLILDELLQNSVIRPIIADLSKVCKQLEQIRLLKGGKKTYHTMVAAYFMDLGQVFQALRPLCKPNSKLCLVIGDSAPYGVYLAVDKWLGELALAAGFKSYYFEKIRDRNIKWKNRKHNVPLHEGRLWIDG
jgi:DNA modification methylase